jgi:LmbE family N-acetylglucosaminyl deacetylase
MNVNILAIASHPDDETFGCGATLSLHELQGTRVGVLCLSCNPLDRKNEFLNAINQLGISESIIWENEDIIANSLTIKKVSNIIVEKRPKIVITHLPFDYHREDKTTFTIVKEAIEWAAHTTIYKNPCIVEKLYLMEVNTLIPTPHVIVDVTECFDKKMKAIEAYTTQLKKFSWGYYQKVNLKKAEMRGVQGGCMYAEAFMLEPIAHNSPFFPEKNTKSLL